MKFKSTVIRNTRAREKGEWVAWSDDIKGIDVVFADTEREAKRKLNSWIKRIYLEDYCLNQNKVSAMLLFFALCRILRTNQDFLVLPLLVTALILLALSTSSYATVIKIKEICFSIIPILSFLVLIATLFLTNQQKTYYKTIENGKIEFYVVDEYNYRLSRKKIVEEVINPDSSISYKETIVPPFDKYVKIDKGNGVIIYELMTPEK